ncbi:unnamed protein product [Bemisia tabaci]|uniref:Coiled-coil domain-containing protein 112 n=2 Tax=Bemisia tabaci TaxID=7038 RepID=A0A9P0G0Z5_BEMTA|nr:unnamed protein product [Bemisia tabaci]
MEKSTLPLIDAFKDIKKESSLNNVENLKNLDLSSFKKKMIAFEKELSDLDQMFTITLKKLSVESDELEEEIGELQRNLEPVDALGTAVLKPFSISTIPPAIASKYPEVEQFQKYLKDWGGHSGGWTDEDHEVFLRLRAKHNPNSVAYYLRQEMPDISAAEVARHESWYQEYCALKAAQQRAINDWRESQNLSKKVDLHQAAIEPPPAPSPVKKRDPAIKEKIQAWKEAKQAELEADRERRLMMEEKRRSEEEARILKQMELREKVKLYKARKLEEAHAAAVAEQDRAVQEAQKAAEMANTLIKQYRQEDTKWIERKKMQRLHFILEEEQRLERERALAASVAKDINVHRDPRRLLQPTKVWEKRLQNSESDEEVEKPTVKDIDQVKHLGIPEWRLGL